MVVRFTPIGAHLFLGLPMHSIANESIDLEQIDARLARAVMRRVGLARSWTDRFAAMESLIAERIAEAEMAGSVDARLAQARGHRRPHRARFTRRRVGLQPSHVDREIPDVRRDFRRRRSRGCCASIASCARSIARAARAPTKLLANRTSSLRTRTIDASARSVGPTSRPTAATSIRRISSTISASSRQHARAFLRRVSDVV